MIIVNNITYNVYHCSFPHGFATLLEKVGLRLQGTELELFRTEPDQIGFGLHGTVWNRSGTDPKLEGCCFAGPVFDLFGSIPDWFQNDPM